MNKIIEYDALAKAKKIDDIIQALKNFNEIMNSEITKISIKTCDVNITREATSKDKIEFIEEEWIKTVEKLSELGLNIE